MLYILKTSFLKDYNPYPKSYEYMLNINTDKLIAFSIWVHSSFV